MSRVPFAALRGVDFHLEQIYEGGSVGHIGDDPLNRLLPVGNQGGFRPAGSPKKGTVRLVVLYSSGANEDWPDTLDPTAGTFTYYGDNREPGMALHSTSRSGNQILRAAFADAQEGAAGRSRVPPFLLFDRADAGGRAVRFRGLLAPGTSTVQPDGHLVAVWRSRNGQRFQNYRALFTVLDVATVTRAWVDVVLFGAPDADRLLLAPAAWREWVRGGAYTPLLAPATTHHRNRRAQQPTTAGDLALLTQLWSHFAGRPTDFEACAAELFRLNSPNVDSLEMTRPSRDGGRDATGHYAIGPAADRVRLEFALEAKCNRPGNTPGNSVGVREVARLISRLKHRQFGVLVTTSYVDEQAYREIRDDGHPVIILAGTDLVQILKHAGVGTTDRLQAWLDEKFPAPAPRRAGSVAPPTG